MFIIGWGRANHAFVKIVLQWRCNAPVPTWLKPPLILSRPLLSSPLSRLSPPPAAGSPLPPTIRGCSRARGGRRIWKFCAQSRYDVSARRAVGENMQQAAVARVTRKREKGCTIALRSVFLPLPDRFRGMRRSFTHSEAITPRRGVCIFRAEFIRESFGT